MKPYDDFSLIESHNRNFKLFIVSGLIAAGSYFSGKDVCTMFGMNEFFVSAFLMSKLDKNRPSAVFPVKNDFVSFNF